MKEFQRAKLMRSNSLPSSAGAEDDKKIFIIIATNENNGHPDLSKDTQQE